MYCFQTSAASSQHCVAFLQAFGFISSEIVKSFKPIWKPQRPPGLSFRRLYSRHAGAKAPYAMTPEAHNFSNWRKNLSSNRSMESWRSISMDKVPPPLLSTAVDKGGDWWARAYIQENSILLILFAWKIRWTCGWLNCCSGLLRRVCKSLIMRCTVVSLKSWNWR